MGSLLPFISITTVHWSMKALVFATVLAVGFSDEETQAGPILLSPYNYGYPGYAGGYIGATHYPYALNAAPLTTVPATTVPYAHAYAPAYSVAAPAVTSSQFAAQDEFGNTQYGYADINSAKHELGNAFHGVTGSYQYVDANGQLQTVNYVADHLGFRVADSRLPVHDAELPVAPVHDAALPVAPVHEYELPVAPVYSGVAPEAVQDTPEVVAAREAHLKAVEEVVASRSKRESDPMQLGYGYNSPWILNRRFQPFYYNGIYAYRNLNYLRNPGYSYRYYG